MKHRTTTSDSSSCREQLRRGNAWQRLGMVLLVAVMMLTAQKAWAQDEQFTVTLTPGDGSGSDIVLNDVDDYDHEATNLNSLREGKFYKDNEELWFRVPGCPDTFTSPGDGKVFLGWNNRSWSAGNYILITENVTLTAYWDNVEFNIRYNTDYSLTFRVTSTSPNEVEIKKVNISRDCNMVIPSTVTYSGTEYAVTRIAERACQTEPKLKSVVIPASVREIGESAFSYCTNLTSADISATAIGYNAFTGCNNLATVTLHSGVTLGNNAFPNSTKLQLATHQAGDAYWATFYFEDRNVVFDETTTVYWAECNGTTLNLHKINERIAERGTAVILKSTKEFPELSFTGDICADRYTIGNYNSLRGLRERTLRNNLQGFDPDKKAIYVFDIKNGEVGFYEYTGEYVPAGQAFLVADKTAGVQGPALVVLADLDNNYIDDYVGQLVTIQNLRIEANMTATYNNVNLTLVGFSNLYDYAFVDLTGIVSLEGTKTVLTATDRSDLDPVVFVIDEDESFVSPDYDIQDAVVRLKRTLSKDYWNTFCVPLDLLNFSWEFRVFDGVEGNTMIFAQGAYIEAGLPYLVKPDEDIVNPVFRDVMLSATAAKTPEEGDYQFVGTYGLADMETQNDNQQLLFLKSDGKLYAPASGNNRIKGMRAYFRAPKGAEARVSIDGAEQTAISDATRLNDKGKMINNHVYDLQGRRVSPLTSPLGSAASRVEEPSPLKKGLYIQGGKKLLVR